MTQAAADIPARIDTLHIINKTPTHARVTQCVAALTSNDAVLLIENGVLVADDDCIRSAPCPVFALAADARARGVGAQNKANSDSTTVIQCVDYEQMVQLSALAKRIISW